MENTFEQNLVLNTVNLSKKYKDAYAIKDVNMHIEKGDIYGFVGENGAGKTTVIRLITGLAAPTEGTFYLFGEEKDAALRKKRVAGIVESVSLNRSMTALENLRYQCFICGIDKTDDELRDILADVGLDVQSIGSKKVKHFSLGMRQRLGIASVIMQDPELVLLDEPMNGLDPQGFVDMRETILRLNEKGVTFLISSHILSELDKVCNKIGFISKGVLVEEILINDLHKKSDARIVVSFATAEDAEAATDKLKDVAGFEDSATVDNAITIYGDVDVNDVLETLVARQIRIAAINVKEKSVEDYYIEKTRR